MVGATTLNDVFAEPPHLTDDPLAKAGRALPSRALDRLDDVRQRVRRARRPRRARRQLDRVRATREAAGRATSRSSSAPAPASPPPRWPRPPRSCGSVSRATGDPIEEPGRRTRVPHRAPDARSPPSRRLLGVDRRRAAARPRCGGRRALRPGRDAGRRARRAPRRGRAAPTGRRQRCDLRDLDRPARHRPGRSAVAGRRPADRAQRPGVDHRGPGLGRAARRRDVHAARRRPRRRRARDHPVGAPAYRRRSWPPPGSRSPTTHTARSRSSTWRTSGGQVVASATAHAGIRRERRPEPAGPRSGRRPGGQRQHDARSRTT